MNRNNIDNLIFNLILNNFNKNRFHNHKTFENNTIGLYHLIRRYINEETVMLEIGSFSGVSSELFALHAKSIVCVDPYESYPEIDYESILSAEKQFAEMMSNYLNITKIKLKSNDAISLFEDETFDLIYIDGAHDYENVSKDIKSWIPKIKKGGYISGHDFSVHDVNLAIMDCGLSIIEVFCDDSWICNV